MASISSVQPSVVNLSPLEFTKLSQPPLLIDVRSQLEYATGHAPGAVNLSLPRILMGSFFYPNGLEICPKIDPLRSFV